MANKSELQKLKEENERLKQELEIAELRAENARLEKRIAEMHLYPYASPYTTITWTDLSKIDGSYGTHSNITLC